MLDTNSLAVYSNHLLQYLLENKRLRAAGISIRSFYLDRLVPLPVYLGTNWTLKGFEDRLIPGSCCSRSGSGCPAGDRTEKCCSMAENNRNIFCRANVSAEHSRLPETTMIVNNSINKTITDNTSSYIYRYSLFASYVLKLHSHTHSLTDWLTHFWNLPLL